MSESNTKTFVRGSFLYLDEAGGYQERENRLEAKQKIVEDKIGILKYQQEIKQKVVEAQNRKKEGQANKLMEKPVLIPIRDTPVEPIPEPVLENTKCERAMQEQFDYFQTYISQKEKERQFEEEEQRVITEFLEKQKRAKERDIENPPSEATAVVMEKEDTAPKTKKILKIKIKKKSGHQTKQE